MVLMNLLELEEIIDFFIITEANITHTGENREFIWSEIVRKESLLRNDKVIYLQMDLRTEGSARTLVPSQMHNHEQRIRNGFQKEFQILPSDIVISVDGDEVLYRQTISKYIKKLNRKIYNRKCYRLRLNQFMFKLGNFLPMKLFEGPVVSKASYFLEQKNPQWRYGGKLGRRIAGCHFSYFMPAEAIENKFKTWAHAEETIHFADSDLIQWGIDRDMAIWDPAQVLKIRKLDFPESPIYPKSLGKILDKFHPCVR